LVKKYGIEPLNQRCQTLPSVALGILRLNYLREPLDLVKPSGIIRKYPTKKGWKTRKPEEIYVGSLDRRRLAIQCAWGGRAEAYGHGTYSKSIVYLDITSLYPSTARLQPLPCSTTKWEHLSKNSDLTKYEGFMGVKFEFPVNTRYPCLPVWDGMKNHLKFPRKGKSYCTIAEIREAIRLGVSFGFIDGWGFIPTEKERNHPIKRFMEDLMKLKARSKEGSAEYLFCKLLINSVVGKFWEREKGGLAYWNHSYN
jgi:hypothetical protein